MTYTLFLHSWGVMPNSCLKTFCRNNRHPQNHWLAMEATVPLVCDNNSQAFFQSQHFDVLIGRHIKESTEFPVQLGITFMNRCLHI